MSNEYDAIKTAFQKASLYDELIKHDFKKMLNCSFCGRSQEEVDKLIAGSGVYICNHCVGLCAEILDEKVEEDAENEIQS